MLYIQNQWSAGKDKLFKSMNPLTGEIVWEGNFANASQLNAAMHAAHNSHDEWSVPSYLRLLLKFELVLLLIIPVLALLMARGIGLSA